MRRTCESPSQRSLSFHLFRHCVRTLTSMHYALHVPLYLSPPLPLPHTRHAPPTRLAPPHNPLPPHPTFTPHLPASIRSKLPPPPSPPLSHTMHLHPPPACHHQVQAAPTQPQRVVEFGALVGRVRSSGREGGGGQAGGRVRQAWFQFLFVRPQPTIPSIYISHSFTTSPPPHTHTLPTLHPPTLPHHFTLFV